MYDLMDEIDGCTRIVDQHERQSYLRQMCNELREQVAEETQKNINGSTYIMIPGATHDLAGNYGVCVDSITSQFLDNPNRPLDLSCLSGMQAQFVMP